MQRPGEWTPTEANAALPKVRALLRDARRCAAAMRDLQEQLDDLRIVWGDAVMTAACSGHQEFLDQRTRFEAEQVRLGESFAAFQSLGVEVKDLEQGLVDFRGTVGDRQAYLCWRDGEIEVGWWHPLDGGFTARRRLSAQSTDSP